MAQGNVKKKANSRSSVMKKTKTQKKSLGAKKGGRAIKPKKGSKSTALIVKKKIEVQIKQSIETTAVFEALKQEHKPLKIIKSTPATANKKNINRKKGKGKK